MKIVITGGAGFIGSHLADKLLNEGHTVLVIDNYATARKDSLSPHDGLSVVEGSVADKDLVNELFNDMVPDRVIHAAASYKEPGNWLQDAYTNIIGSLNVINASKRVGVRRLIYLQTAHCYGTEFLEEPIGLNHPLHPEGNSYAISKTAAEQYLDLSGIDFISFRFSNAYGPRNLRGPLPRFYHRLTTSRPCMVTDGRRDFIYVDDVADLILKAADGEGNRGVYHISSGTDISIKEVFDETCRALGIALVSDVEVRPQEPGAAYSFLLDPSKTFTDFNWKPQTSLRAGIQKTMEWYKEYGVTQSGIPLKSAKA